MKNIPDTSHEPHPNNTNESPILSARYIDDGGVVAFKPQSIGFTFSAPTLIPQLAQLPGLMMQAVVSLGPRTSDGPIVEVVTIPWFQIITELTRDPSAMFKVPARKWEEIIAGAYVRAPPP